MLNEKFIKVLYIDLETEKIRIEQREDLLKYLGGVGVASKLLQENLRSDLSPCAPEQPVVFAIGPGAYILPVLTKTVAMFVSPLTGELGESYAGGRMSMSMLMAGYDALVITGKAKKYSYLTISTQDVNIRDARAMWGLQIKEALRNIRDREHDGGLSAGKRSILCIGPAGENGVAYANVCVDLYRHFGRLGLGACLGSKNLKAIMVYGNRSIPIMDQKRYFKVYREIYKKCTATDNMAKYHDAGTPINILPLNKAGGLPTLNLQSGTFEHAEEVSGEVFAQKNLIRKLSCNGCPVGCIHIGMYRREFDKGHEYEAISVAYDYELIFALGTFLGIKSTDEIIAIIEEVEEYGLDAMSTGVCLGWATESLEQGYLTINDTLVELKFGDAEGYIKAIRYMSERVNNFYRILGKGSRHAASKYGGEDFAMQIGGNEMAGYHTGYGSLVGAAVGARHSHLCNGGYGLDQNMKEFDEDKFVESLLSEECERCMTNSLVMCLFARKIYDRQTILDALNSIGWDLSNDDLTAIGRRIYQTKLQIKNQLGFQQKGVKLPKRFFQTPSMNGKLDEETAYRLIRKYTEKTDELMKESYE
ncbi:MAG: aldehyde:ferredoxin oxidoreductase [Defluviitaleaceae bacterium]|nr:aldehyde:ferredoxin oxidoreductase [Defluviitaleaceae bacterium]